MDGEIVKMRHTKRKSQLVLLAVLVLLSAACAPSTRMPSLANTAWVLVRMDDSSPIDGTQFTLQFQADHLSGSMGCNLYGGGPDSGGYTASRDGTLSISRPFAVTVQLCADPEGIMEQEDAYIETLLDVAEYRIRDDRLELIDSTGAVRLVFDRAE